MTDTTLWTMNKIKEHMRAAGSHWFDPDTMRYFKCRLSGEVYQGPGGIYFVSSEQGPHGPRKCTVRRFTPETADIDTAGEFNSMSRAQAVREAKRLAGVDEATTAEEFKPVSKLQQFVHDLRKHCQGGKVTVADARTLISLAKRHAHLEELRCGDEAFCRELNEDGEHPRTLRVEARIERLAKRLGAAGVIFSGDPRGCTVKLTFADGETNDFGKEGWCVPQ
jgi:hypothetical protein